jgi:hypothetical protein
MMQYQRLGQDVDYMLLLGPKESLLKVSIR